MSLKLLTKTLLKQRECRGVAQSGSALAWGASGRRFKSSRPDPRGESYDSPLVILTTARGGFNDRLDRGLLVCLMITMISACGPMNGRRPPSGEWVTIQSGDTVSALAERHHISIDDLIEINGLTDPSRILVGQRLFLPQFERELSARRTSRARAQVQSSASSDAEVDAPALQALEGAPPELMRRIQWPVEPALERGIGLSSGFGQREGRPHQGIDLRAPKGTPIRAALSGEVTRSEESTGGYGLVIYIQHSGGVETRYAHNQNNLVKVGRHVQAGEVIAEVGSSGRSTGPHLHFEIRIRGSAIDPLIVLPALPAPLSTTSSQRESPLPTGPQVSYSAVDGSLRLALLSKEKLHHVD